MKIGPQETNLSLTVRNVKLLVLAGMYKKNLLSGEVLEGVNSFKYLGVFIDKHLNFDLHIEYVGIKLAKFNGMLFRARNFFTKTFSLQMYNSYAKPMISYGILAYGSAKKNKTQFDFLSKKTHFKNYLFQKERRPCMLSFQALQRAVNF